MGTKNQKLKCLDEEKAVKVSEKVVPNDTEKSYEITSKVLPSLPSDDWHDEVVSSESLVSSMKKPEESSRSFWKTSPVMLSLIPNTPSVRLSLLWTSSMLWNDKAELCTVSVDKRLRSKRSF